MIVSDADIIEALQKYRGIVTSAAKQVGMTRSSLSRRIHRTKHLEEELHEIRETAVDDAEQKRQHQAMDKFITAGVTGRVEGSTLHPSS